MRFRVTQPFLAFGKAPEVGDIIELTTDQAEALQDSDLVVPYEIKIAKPVKERKVVKKQLRSLRQGRASQKKTAK